MKKAMKWVIALAILVVIGYGLWMGNQKYEEYAEDKAEAVENLAEAEYGASYVYSKEDVEYFKSKALEQMDKEVKKYDLSYGENALIKSNIAFFKNEFIQMLGEDGVEELTENRKTETYFMTDSDAFEECELIYSKGTSIDNILNKDLSLKNPKVFYGYTSLDNPSKRTKILKSNPKFEESFNYFVTFLKEVDERYKNSSTDMIVKKMVELDNVFIEPYGWTTDVRLGETYTLYQQWLSENKENSLNPLQKLLRVEKIDDIDELAPWGLQIISPLKEKDYVRYEPLADEFNYFVANESQYFTTYWPSAVSKIDDYTYIVHISTDKPVERLGATNIVQNILRYFNHNESKYNGQDYTKIIVKIGDEVYHDMNSGILMADVLNGNSFVADDGVTPLNSQSYASQIPPWQAWSPSKEVRPWVDAYFSAAANAYKEDSYFSIFETIEQVAEEFNVEYEDVENVIMSCYWTFNGWDFEFYSVS